MGGKEMSSDTLSQCEAFLGAIFEPGDIIEFRTLPTPAGRKWGTLDDLPKLVSWMQSQNRAGKCIFAGANPRTVRGKGTEEYVALARCHFADFDGVTVEEALRRIEAAGLPVPTIIVSTGGGVHAWWLLTEPVTDAAAWTARQKMLARVLDSDPKVSDWARVMRLPGFVNTKEKYDHLDPRPASAIVDIDPSRRYPVEAIEVAEIEVPEVEEATEPEVLPLPSPSVSDSNVIARAERYVEAMPGAVSGQGGHDKTYAVACALVNGFDLDQGTAIGIMQRRYNPRCEPEWSAKELQHKVKDAATKTHDKPRGYLRDEPLQPQSFADVDLSAFDTLAAASEDDEAEVDVTELLGGPAERLPSGPDDPGPFPSHLLDVPGFVSEVMRHNLDTAHRKQPVLALAGALCLQGVIAGRKVRDRSGTRTNIYCMGLAPTGMGKDHARKINKQILYEAGLDQLEGAESAASDTGIESAVAETPAVLFQFDEFGRFLATLGDARGMPHLFRIVDVLMKLFTSAGGIYKAKAYADKTNNRVVNQPCAVLYGTTVEESFLRSLTRENVSDGLLSRMLIFEGDRLPPLEYEAMEKPVPSAVLNVATYWRDFQSEFNLANVNPDPIVVDTGSEADLIFRDLVKLSDREFGKGLPGCELWTRTLEKARKLALIYACSANHERPVIDGLAALWASEVVQYMTRRMIFLADRWIADGRFDALQKEVVRKIEKRGGRVSKGEMCRVILRRVKSKERDEILRNMLETGQLRQSEVKSKTKPATFYEVA
jgi:hypothetical protein